MADLRRKDWQTGVTRWPLDVSTRLEIQGGCGRGQAGQTAFTLEQCEWTLTEAPQRMQCTLDWWTWKKNGSTP